MKPSFALDFRDGLVTLLHRTSRGWSQVGSTAFDAPDFAEALGYMRSTALGLSPRGITTKLIIPNDQILYTPIHAPGPDAAKRKRQIKAGLEGRTPYAVEDLVYDWWGNGPDLNVAVIAKETLAEAEAFATEHRFNPVSFVGVPDNGIFLGEPYFGPTALAATLLTEGEKVERDQEPVTIIARDFQRGDVKAKAAEPVAEAVEAAAPVAEDRPPETEAVAAAAVVEKAAPEPEVLAAEPTIEAAPEPEQAQPEPVAPVEVAAPEPVPPEPVFEPVRAPAPRPNRPQPPVVQAEAPEAPMAMDVVAETPARPEDDLPPAPAAEIVAAFANRRSAAIAAATAGTAKQASAAVPKIPQVGAAPAQRPTVPRPNAARPAPATPRDIPRDTARDTLPFPAKQNGAAAKPPAGKAGKPVSPSVTAASIIGARRERNVVPLPTAGTPEEQAAAAARRASVKPPTGLGSRAAPVKGKPRYLGLILTVVLLVLLVAVAAWSSFFMGANDTTGTGAGVPETTSPAASLSAPAAAPEATTPPATAPTTTAEATATVAEPAPVPTDTTTASATPTAPAADAAAAAPAAPQASDQTAGLTTGASTASAPTTAAPSAQAPLADATPAPAAAKAAPTLEPAPKTEVTTLAMPAVVPSTAPQDKIVVAMADTPPKPVGPTALPAVAAGADASPAAEPPPPPYGTVYKFDADGRIIPTPEGIITPEGVMLIAGKPKLAPPPRPAELAPVAPASADAPVAQATDTSAAATNPAVAPAADAAKAPALPATAPAVATTSAQPSAPALVPDPTLADKRPKDRPADLTPATDQQGAVAASPEDTRLASLHPAARPKDLPVSPLAPDTGADATAASASLAAKGFALSSSLKPIARPSGLDQAVDKAVADALNDQPAPEPQLASNNVAPEAQSEPEVEAPAPNMPTNANVAKQATTKRAINTNKLALLAVFGTPSTRFAMVRQGNGTIKKIKVGDTVDGGSVAAITENSVQYQKGGRIVTLSLPTG